jgi:hypothetical protein
MRFVKILVIFFFCIAIPGCAMQYTLPEHYTPANTTGLQVDKLPLKDGIVLPDESLTMTKTWINPQMESNTLTMTVPVGALQGKASRSVFPALFETLEYIKGKPYPPELDVVYVPVISDWSFGYAGASGFKQGYYVQLRISSTITDVSGARIFTDEVTTTTRMMRGMVGSEKGDKENWGKVFSQAINEAFLKAAAEIGTSRELQRLAGGKAGTVRPKIARDHQPFLLPASATAPSPGPATLSTTAGTKLKKALETGAISAEQLGKAMEELERNAPSKLLRSFLDGELTDRQFGELY